MCKLYDRRTALGNIGHLIQNLIFYALSQHILTLLQLLLATILYSLVILTGKLDVRSVLMQEWILPVSSILRYNRKLKLFLLKTTPGKMQLYFVTVSVHCVIMHRFKNQCSSLQYADQNFKHLITNVYFNFRVNDHNENMINVQRILLRT